MFLMMFVICDLFGFVCESESEMEGKGNLFYATKSYGIYYYGHFLLHCVGGNSRTCINRSTGAFISDFGVRPCNTIIQRRPCKMFVSSGLFAYLYCSL